jgi:hypothetical protein
MSPEREMTFRFADPRAPVQVLFSLHDSDADILRAFLTEARLLQEHLLKVGGIPAQLSIRGEPGGKATISGQEPDPVSFAATLHRLRPFILEDEPFSFKRVRGIVARASSNEFLQERLKEIKHLYFGNHLRSQLRVHIGTFELTSETALKQWLNTAEYHRDLHKAAALKEALGPLPLGASRPILIAQIAQKSKAVLHLGYIVAKMIDEASPIPGIPDPPVR